MVSQRKQLDRTIMTLAVLGSLVLLNVVGLAFFGRLDLTRHKQFSLSQATRSLLRELHEPLTVRAYFTKDLPPPHASNARYVRDMLEEYYAQSHGKVRFEFIDPAAEETSEDKEKRKELKQDIFGRAVREATSMERDLQQQGISPVQVRVNEDDKLEVKRAYMGLAVHFGDKKQVIPVVSDTAGLEYELTTMMRKLVRIKAPKVGLVSGHGGLSPQQDYGKAHAMLAELYEMREVDLAQDLPPDLDALLVVGPKSAFSAAEKQRLDAFMRAGHSTAFFLAAIKPSLQNLQSEDNAPELGDLLAAYGLAMEPGLMLDAECATISVAQQAGFMRINQPVRYPYILLPRSLEDGDLTRGLAQVALPFISPVQVKAPEGGAVQAQVLARSSATSWVQNPPYNLDPMQHWTPPAGGSAAATRPLMVALTGTFQGMGAAASPPAADLPKSRILLAGGAAWLTDPFFAKPNETLLLNLVDWLVRDDDLLAVRSRGLAAAPLRPVSDSGRNAAKYLNIIGLPTAFIGFGLVRWRRREARRARVTL